MNPKISVVVPCYNHAKYIGVCLNSVPSAYSGSIELLFCDDASQDGSYNEAKKILDELENNFDHISCVILKNAKNKGVCYTLNALVNRATADFVYLIASDDFLIEGALTRAVESLERGGFDALVSDCHVVGRDGSVVSDSALFKYRKGDRRLIGKGFWVPEFVMNWILPGPCLLLRRSVYSKVGLYDESLIVEDRDFYLRLFSSVRVGFSANPIACYRVHDSNTFSKKEISGKIHRELSFVNWKYSSQFSFPLNVFLMSFYLDLMLPDRFLVVAKVLRRVISYPYRFYLKYMR